MGSEHPSHGDEITAWRAVRGLQLALAACWLLDAVLQYQPFMFGRGFARMLADASQPNPAVIAAPAAWAAHLTAQYPVPANTAFATFQLLLALGIAWRPTVRPALAASVAWSLAVWWLGEGLGGVLTPAASPVTGAPGAAVLYALLAVLLWPRAGERDARARPCAAAGAVGAPAARVLWVVLWGSLAWLALANAPAAGAGLLASGTGPVLLALGCCLIASGIMLPPRAVRWVLAAAVVVALAMWAAGQGFGDIFTGMGTDPGTGPVLALLAIAYWPRRAGGVPAPRAAAARASGAFHGLAAARRDVVAMQVLMGAATAAMLVPRLDPVPPLCWQALAAAGVAWFTWHSLRHAADGRAGHDLSHVLACAAMLFMLLAPAGAMTGHAMAAAAGPGGVRLAMSVCALLFALAMLVSAIITADQLTAQPAGGTAAVRVLPLRMSACCQIAMTILMAHLLIQML